MNYTLNQLRIFLKVTETQSITKTAEALHLTQPAVSIQLKNFQDQFDLPLIEVINRRVFITEFGSNIAESARRILEEVHEIEFKTQAHRGLLTGSLRIAVVSTGIYIAPEYIASFMKRHEQVELILDVTNKARVIAALEANEVDFAIVSVLPEHMRVEKKIIKPSELYLVANGAEKFSKRAYDKKIFERIPLIYRESGSGTRQVMERFIKRNRLPVQKKMELTGNEVVKQAVIAGLGYSILPLSSIQNELANGQLQIIPVKGFPIQSNWYLIWLKDKKLSPAAKAFLQEKE